MILHRLNKRCDECWKIYSVRRPRVVLIVAVIAAIQCPTCHPEALADCCSGCRLPFSAVKLHSNGQCKTRAFDAPTTGT
jgi:hypothetical protein